jgi:hypothetical protein
LPERAEFEIDGNGRRGREVGNAGDRFAFGGQADGAIGDVGGELNGLKGEWVFTRAGAKGTDAVWQQRFSGPYSRVSHEVLNLRMTTI